MMDTKLTAVESNRSYWLTLSENIKNGWEKVKSNIFVNLFLPLEDLSEGNTMALLPYAVPGGGAARTIVKGGKSLLNRLNKQTVKKLTQSEIEKFISLESALAKEVESTPFVSSEPRLVQNVEVKTIGPKDIHLTKDEVAYYNAKRKEAKAFLDAAPRNLAAMVELPRAYPEYFIDPDISNASRAMFDLYRNAMHRHRTYTWWGFPKQFEYGWPGILYGRSALLGSDTGRYFKVSHFAPKNLREGYELIKLVAGSTLPTVFTVTDDLAKQLKKAGFKEVAEIPLIFNGETVNKKVMINAAVKKEDVLEDLKEMALYYPEYGDYIKLVENTEWPTWTQSEFGPYPIPEEYNLPATQKLGELLNFSKIK